MRSYLQLSYYTLKGIVNYIDLGNFVYGEWIVYQDDIPQYHISCFDSELNSNKTVFQLLESKKESIESIVNKINHKYKINLSFNNRPFIRFLKKSESANWDLIPLPEDWLKNLD